MANKLAGQKAKYTKALAEFNSTEDDVKKRTAGRKLCEVLLEAPQNGFVEAEVTGGHEIPGDVQKMVEAGKLVPQSPAEDPSQLVRQLERKVDTSDLREAGSGDQCIYAYGYRCAPDRLKVGRCDGDVIDRIASQINTSTPDKPALFLIIHTPDCRALEMAMHGLLRLDQRRVTGGGDEWFLTTADELLEFFKRLGKPSG